MSPRPSSQTEQRKALGQALRLVRRARGLTAKAAAATMGVSVRHYAYLEAGRGNLDLDRVRLFAAATDSDAHAIILAGLIESPSFALRSADNKLAAALLMALQEFDLESQDDLRLLDTRSCVSAFLAAFATLASEARRQAGVRDHLASGANKPMRPGDSAD